MPGADRDIHAIEDENALRAIFAIFDANGDGLLQRDEVETFAAAFRKPNSPKGCDNVDKIMESMDFANGDGTIQFPEFEAYIKAGELRILQPGAQSIPLWLDMRALTLSPLLPHLLPHPPSPSLTLTLLVQYSMPGSLGLIRTRRGILSWMI